MKSIKMSLFEFWRSKGERRAFLVRTNQRRLLPSQLEQLLGDSGVRAELQDNRVASLLPPVGTEVFRRFTPASLQEIQQRHEAEEKEQERRKKMEEVAEKEQPKPASELEAEKLLPFIYGDPPPELLKTPLEELDPFYQSQKTFLVLGEGNMVHRFNAEPSCYLLSPFNPLRTVAIKILLHLLFNVFIMLTILTNCALMVISDPPAWTDKLQYVFTAIYTFEAIVKIVSRGFCVGKFTFLRDPWNWLDVTVIILAFVSEFTDLHKFSVLSLAPRILKIIPVISGMKVTVGAFVQSVKRLAGVIVLLVLGLCVLSVICMHLFMGNLRNKCVILPAWSNQTDDDTLHFTNQTPSSGFSYSEYLDRMENYYFLPGLIDPLLCGNTSDSGSCPEGFTCVSGGRNPNYGFTSYDSIGWSLLSQIRLMTQDFWDNLMMLTLRSSGKAYLTVFMLVIFPSTFCLLSLLLAVVVMAFCEQEEAIVTEAKRKEEQFKQIVEALKKRGETEQAEHSENQNGEDDQKRRELENQSSCPPCCLVLLQWNCCGCWRWCKQRLYTFVTNPFFDLVIVICLISNILHMSTEHYPMTEEFEWQWVVADLVFTAIFAAEMVLKILALDPYGYFQVGWNTFESILVLQSLIDLALADVQGLFRLNTIVLRVLRLARWWPSFNMFLGMIWRSMRNVTLLLFIMVFFFTVVGMQLFQQDYENHVCCITVDCELPRWHMTNFFSTFLVIFRVLCGEWVEMTWDCMEVSGKATCLVFFMTVVIIGNLLILNVFLTLLLSSFIFVAPEEKDKNNIHKALEWIKTWILALLGKKDPDHTGVDSKEDNRKEYLALNLVMSDQPMSEVKVLSSNINNQTSSDHNIKPQKVPIAMAEVDIEFKTPEDEQQEKKCDDIQKPTEHHEDHEGNTPEDCCSDNTSQGAGRVWSNVKRACLLIVQHKYFEITIIIIIMLSSVALMFEDVHLHQRQVLKMVVEMADRVFTYLFLLEMLLKWIAHGLKKYFTNAWCWLDFLILDVFLVSLMADMLGFSGTGAIQFLRTLRALGPLRALSRFPGLRLVVEVLVQTIRPLFDVLLVCLTVWLLFGIVGVGMFAGKFHYCFNETSEEYFLPEVVNNKTDCFSLIMMNFTEIRWKNLHMNYDNLLNGYLALLHLVTSADWMDILYAAVDARLVEDQPVYEHNIFMHLYFVCFFIIGSFFTFTFLIRAIMDYLQRDKFGRKRIFMTDEQYKFSKCVKERFSRYPQAPGPRPQNRARAWLFDLVTSRYFEFFIMGIICLNMVILAVETYDQSYEVDEILHWFQFTFILIFFIEFILKISAFRQHYFADGLNVLDFVVLVMLIIGMFLADLMEKYFVSPHVFRMLRLVRVAPVFCLIRWARGIKRLLSAFVGSLPALFNIGLVFLLLMVTFSIFGMFNFAYVKKEYMISDMFNFETFWNSMICVFMISTTSGWGGMLYPMMNNPPDCDPYAEHPGFMVKGDCGNPTLGIVFFFTFSSLSYLLVVYLYLTVVLETLNSEDMEMLSDDDLQRFYKTWSKFDPDASQFIPYSELSDFCSALQGPLRIPKPNTIKLRHMDLPLFPGDKIYCVDVFLALASQVLGESAEMDALKARMEERFPANSSKVSNVPISSTLHRKQEEEAAKVI
ncbi:sodium channel protein type 4 subunit alpha B-like isoform X1 [Acanthopagrus latus]|uniref:sodium channel protein type 4 subunit alpha B-like isoform X1 n=1 Tax=Acanthopagrus latus TaxID=8177 RepID=UPI00187C6E6B|nr:sodium channel protein type 4 subunit alpha B-like isoform X1 [Acanthopagrus latus]